MFAGNSKVDFSVERERVSPYYSVDRVYLWGNELSMPSWSSFSLYKESSYHFQLLVKFLTCWDKISEKRGRVPFPTLQDKFWVQVEHEFSIYLPDESFSCWGRVSLRKEVEILTSEFLVKVSSCGTGLWFSLDQVFLCSNWEWVSCWQWAHHLISLVDLNINNTWVKISILFLPWKESGFHWWLWLEFLVGRILLSWSGNKILI